MYNPDVKEKYIAYTSTVSSSSDIATYAKGLFNRFKRTESLEKEHGKDILDMPQDELKQFLGQFLSGGTGYQDTDLSMLKSYCYWGMENGESSLSAAWLDGLKLKDISVVQTYADIMVSSEADLIACIDPLLDDIKRDSMDNIIRCICLLLFAGIKYEDIWWIKADDVNLKERSVLYRNKTIYMTDALYDVIFHNWHTDQMLVVGKGKNTEYMVDIKHEGFLISNTKEYYGERDKMMRTYNPQISRILSSSSKRDLTNTTIYDSGVFYRIYQNEKETGVINCLEYLWARRNMATTINFPDRVKSKCEYEYTKWKSSFGIEL